MAQQKTINQYQGLFFLLVGGAAAFTHFLVLEIEVEKFGLLPAWANFFAFCVAFLVSFSGHFYLTFKGQVKKENLLKNCIKWFLSSVSGFCINQALFLLGLYYFGQDAYIAIWLLVTFIVTVMTFSLAKFWAFKKEATA